MSYETAKKTYIALRDAELATDPSAPEYAQLQADTTKAFEALREASERHYTARARRTAKRAAR